MSEVSVENPAMSVIAAEIVSPEPAELVGQGLGPLAPDAAAASLYLDLLKRTLANLIYQDPPFLFYDVAYGPTLADRFDLSRRVTGEDIPSQAHTMIGVRRLENIQYCIEQVLVDNVPGDLIEMGVASGGSAIFMRGVLKAHGSTDRRVFAADAFEDPIPQRGGPIARFLARWIAWGLASIPIRAWRRRLGRLILKNGKSFPPTDDPSGEMIEAALWFMKHIDVGIKLGQRGGLKNVQSNFARYGLLDDQVCFLRGFFADTLPTAPLEQVAVMRLDGDMYVSTMDGLNNVYPRLASGGFCIVDDYHTFKECARAVDEYRAAHDINDPIRQIDRQAVFWRKS